MRTTFPVTASPAVWATIADPAGLAAALPGCRSVTRDDTAGEGTLQVVTEVVVASVRGLWAGTIVPVDGDAVRVRGAGAPGTVDLVVRADPDRTVVTVEGTVTGPLGTVGAAVLAAAVRRTAHDLLAAAGAPAPEPSPGPAVEPVAVVTRSTGSAEGAGPGTAAPAPAARRLLGGAVVMGGAAAVVVASRRWRRRVAAAGRDVR